MPFLNRLTTLEPFETWPSMEQAAEQRFSDGLALATTEAGHEGGAIYLLGYVAEMLVKTAYCRVISHSPGNAVFPAFQAAQSDGAWQGGNLHSLSSWVAFLVHTRTRSGNPLDPAVAGQIIAHVLTVDAHWREWLRYRATPATVLELEEVYGSVSWLIANHAALWT